MERETSIALKSKARPTLFVGAGITTLGALLLSASPAAADLILSTPTQNFAQEHDAFDNLTTSGATTTIFNYGPGLNFSQFDTAQGVLTGAQLILSTTTRKAHGSIAANGTHNGGGAATALGTNGSTASITAPNGESFSLPGSAPGNPSCSRPGGVRTCSGSVSPAAISNVNVGHQVSSANLGLYAGLGTVTLQPSAALSAQASTSGAHPFANVNDAYSLNWSGTLGIAYSYVYHASPSFDGLGLLNNLTVDFGTVGQGSGGGQLSNGFSIYNLIAQLDAADTADVKLGLINGSGNLGTLNSDVSLFNALHAGASDYFDAFLNTTAIGGFQTDYDFGLFDDVPGGVGMDSYNLHLTLLGKVVATPEPATMAVFGIGLAGLWFGRRKKLEHA